MQDDELIRRLRDLSDQCEDKYMVTHSGFLTPADCIRAQNSGIPNLYLFGGADGCERKVAFFLPDYMQKEHFEAWEYISAFTCNVKFTQPTHRDYMGSLLGLGLERKCIGDIHVEGQSALFFCLQSVSDFILQNFDRVGRNGIILNQIHLNDVVIPEKNTEPIRFTVAGTRLDSVTAGLFNISRSKVTDLISAGIVTLNYETSLKPDTRISQGDIISLRGKGKAKIELIGQPTRKGRIPVSALKYV